MSLSVTDLSFYVTLLDVLTDASMLELLELQVETLISDFINSQFGPVVQICFILDPLKCY